MRLPTHLRHSARVFLACICVVAVSGVAEAANTIYVGNGTNQVSVINIATGVVVDTIAGVANPDGMATSGTGVYAVNSSDDTVTIIDTTNNEVEDTISVGDNPYIVAISGTGAFVSNYDDSSVSVIDITDKVVATVATGVRPNGIAVSGTGVYVTIEDDNTVIVIDATNHEIEDTINVGTVPARIAISGTGAYTSNFHGDDVTAIDIANNEVEATIAVGSNPWGIAVSGTGVYVANNTDDTVSVIDTTNFVVERTFSVADDPYAVGTTGTGVFVSNYSSNTITVIDTSNQQIERTISVDFPAHVAFTTDEVTREPTLTLSASAQICANLSVSYSLPELPLSGSVTMLFYNTSTHVSITATMNNTQNPSFSLDLDDLSASANVVSTAGGNGLALGSYIVYLSYRDSFSNPVAQDTSNLTITECVTETPSDSPTPTTGGSGGRRGSGTARTSHSAAPEAPSAPAKTCTQETPLFRDVPTDSWFSCFVQRIVGLKIFEGYKTLEGTPVGLFGPSDSITLGQLAKVGKILHDKADFADKPKGDEWFMPYMNAVKRLRLSVFAANVDALAPATRGQVIQIILEALGIPMEAADSTYDDVSASHPFAKAIATATKLGIVSGDDGTRSFRPDEPVNRAEVAKMLDLALEHVGIEYLDQL